MTTELRALKQVLEYFDIDTTNVPEELYKVVFNAVALAIPLHREQGEAYPTQGGDLPSIAEIYSTPLEDKLTEPNRDLFDEAVGYCNKHSLTGKPFEVVHSAFIDGALWQAAPQEKGVRWDQEVLWDEVVAICAINFRFGKAKEELLPKFTISKK